MRLGARADEDEESWHGVCWFPHMVPRLQIETALPYQRLMIAVLQDAVRLIRQHAPARHRENRRLLAETVAWVRSDDDTWPFAFVTICHALGLDVNGVRAALLGGRTRARRAERVGVLLPSACAHRHAS